MAAARPRGGPAIKRVPVGIGRGGGEAYGSVLLAIRMFATKLHVAKHPLWAGHSVSGKLTPWHGSATPGPDVRGRS